MKQLKVTEESKAFSFFSHKACEYFPCHQGIATEDFNCLFCYCPLYTLGKDCGGAPKFYENGIKDCSNCKFPHHRHNYSAVTERFQDLVKVMQQGQQSRG